MRRSRARRRGSKGPVKFVGVDADRLVFFHHANIPVVLAYHGLAYGTAHRTDEARHCLAGLQRAADSAYLPPTYFAMVYAGLGEFENAFEWLDKAVEARDASLLHLRFIPQMDRLREHSRWHALLRRIKLAA